MSYKVGDRLRFSCSFYDEDDELADPTSVEFSYKNSSGSTTVDEDDLTQVGVGVYIYDLAIEDSGEWSWRWVGSGHVARAAQGRFFVPGILT